MVLSKNCLTENQCNLSNKLEEMCLVCLFWKENVATVSRLHPSKYDWFEITKLYCHEKIFSSQYAETEVQVYDCKIIFNLDNFHLVYNRTLEAVGT